jgi:nucleoid-associated protein YgaU
MFSSGGCAGRFQQGGSNMNDEQIKEEKPAGSSRLGKEARIGATVILALVLILGVVATMRFTRSATSDTFASTEVQLSDKEKPGQENRLEAAEKHGRKRLPAGNNEAAIVVTAAPASTNPSEFASRDSKLWKFGSDKGDAQRSENGSSAIVSPPPLISDSPNPRHHEHYGREATDPLAGRNAEGVGQLRDAGSEVPLVSLDAEPRSQSTNVGVGRVDPSGFAVVESTPPVVTHPRREQSRYADVAAQPPELSPSQNSTAAGYDASVNPGTSSGVSDYRSVSAEPAYRSREPHRSSIVSTPSNPPPPRDDGKYEVQPNDSYWTVSERLYGTSAYFKALTAHNRDKGKGQETLRPGDLILAPPVAQLEQLYPDLCPKAGHREAQQSQGRASMVSTSHQFRSGRTYTVAEGDTLFNIARYELGKASRWVEIYELNRHVLGKDFNYLTPGIQLSLPDREKSDTLTRQPGNAYQR